jgi:hypothetical protein
MLFHINNATDLLFNLNYLHWDISPSIDIFDGGLPLTG